MIPRNPINFATNLTLKNKNSVINGMIKTKTNNFETKVAEI